MNLPAVSRTGAIAAAAVVAAAALPAAASAAETGARLAVEAEGSSEAWISYGGAPAFGFGLSPQGILTNLPPGEAIDPDLDFRDFAEWAAERGVTVVRSYPPSRQVGPRWLDAFERAQSDPDRFDLERFDGRYFARLREACEVFRENGIFVHLQRWQAVAWKKSWAICYYHPDQNVNPEISRHAGPGAFVIEPERNPRLIAHQRAWVRRILEATGDLGNVYYDVMNEIGNGTGGNARWLEAMLDEVEAWESETGLDVLVGLNDEGNDRAVTGWSLSNPRLDIAFLDLGRYDQHVEARPRSARVPRRPGDLPLFARGRRGLRSANARERARARGALAYRAQPDCSGFLPTTMRVPALRHLAGAVPVEVVQGPAPFAYAWGAPGCVIVLLETTPGTAGATITAGELVLRLPEGIAEWAAGAPLAVRAWDLSSEASDPLDPGSLARAAARDVSPSKCPGSTTAW